MPPGAPAGVSPASNASVRPARSGTASLDSLAALVQSRHPLIVLQSLEERRAFEVVVAAARTCQLAVTVLPWGIVHGEPKTLLEALCGLADPAEDTVYVVFDLDLGSADPLVVRGLKNTWDALRSRRSCVVGIQGPLYVPGPLQREVRVVELPLPSQSELCDVVRAVAGEALSDAQLARWAEAARGLARDDVRALMVRALTEGWAGDASAAMHIRAAKRTIALAARAVHWVEPDTSWDDVGGLGALRVWLERRRAAFSAEARAYGLPAPKGVLLLGVQGCGKSLCAKAVADLWGIPLARLDLPLLFRQGSSPELEMHQCLLAVESLAPAALWVDEIDKIWSSSGLAPSDAASRALALLVTWLQERGADVPIIATANAVANLPPELLRKGRFDEIFFVDLPTEQERMEILRIHVGKLGRMPDAFDLQRVAAATEHFSGAELERVVLEAMHEAFADGREVATADLVLAASETVPLYVTFEEPVRALREWARGRARPASQESLLVDLFR